MDEAQRMGAAAPSAATPWSSLWASRAVWFTVFVGSAAVALVAASLTPDPAGHGTHMQLGMPPCGFLASTGLPCPGCGLTTCFAHMVRLEISPALRANVFGVPLFGTMIASMPLAAWGFARNAPVVDSLLAVHAEKVLLSLSLFAVVVWAIRIGLAL